MVVKAFLLKMVLAGTFTFALGSVWCPPGLGHCTVQPGSRPTTSFPCPPPHRGRTICPEVSYR